MLQTVRTEKVPSSHSRSTVNRGKRPDRIDAALSPSGTTITLDELLAAIGQDETVAYELVADAVREGRLAVEFDATGRPFPHRDLMVRRL